MIKILWRTLSDEELVVTHGGTANTRHKLVNFFYTKHNDLFKTIAAAQRRKFYSVALVSDDLLWLAESSIVESIDAYRIYLKKNSLNGKPRYSFRLFLSQNYRFKALDYLKKYTAKKHCVLNCSRLVNNINNQWLYCGNEISETMLRLKLLLYREQYKQWFNKIKRLNTSEIEIWAMKMKGYHLREIAFLTKYKYTKIDNTIQKILRKLQSIRQEHISTKKSYLKKH